MPWRETPGFMKRNSLGDIGTFYFRWVSLFTLILGLMGVKVIKEFNNSDLFQTQELWEQCNEKWKNQRSHRRQTHPRVMENAFSVPVLAELFPEKWSFWSHAAPASEPWCSPWKSDCKRLWWRCYEFNKIQSFFPSITQIRPSALCIAPQAWGSSFPAALFFFFSAISWAAPVAYGGSQARGLIGAVAAGLRQSHSNVGSEPRLRPTPQLTATPDR